MTCRAALQPKLYSPLGMWALQQPSPLVDRSGNARDLTTVANRTRPDLQLSQRIVNPTVAGSAGGFKSTDAAFRLVGAFTLTARAWFDGNALVNVIADQSDTGNTESKNTLFTCGISAAKAFMYRETGQPFVGASFSHTQTLDDGRWYFVSFRRDAAGLHTIGVGLSFVDANLGPASGGSATTLRLGTDAEPGQLFNGGFGDVAIWGARLTDAQLGPLYRASMGVT